MEVAGQGSTTSDEMKTKKQAAEIVGFGFDLGTTTSCLAMTRKVNGQLVTSIEALEGGPKTTQSYVCFYANSPEIVVGNPAAKMTTDANRTVVYEAKRLIGRDFDHPDVQEMQQRVAYKIINRNGQPKIKLRWNNMDKELSPEEVLALILRKLRTDGEEKLSMPIRKGIVTVPAYYLERQRKAVKRSGELAGLEVTKVVNEPTAAAIYHRRRYVNTCTFDVTAMQIRPKMVHVKGSDGDQFLGGSDFDKSIMDDIATRVGQSYDSLAPKNKSRLRIEAKDAKESLTQSLQAEIEVDIIFGGDREPETITRQQFEEMNQGLFDSTLELVDKTLAEASMEHDAVHFVVMNGGSAQIPAIVNAVKNKFSNATTISIDLEEAVAKGASFIDYLDQAKMGNQNVGMTVYDAVCNNIGVETHGKDMEIMIGRGQKLPVVVVRYFSPEMKGQTRARINVFEGKSKETAQNMLLGSFVLHDLPTHLENGPNIRVKLDLEADSTLTISARVEVDDGRRNTERLRLSYSVGGVTLAELQEMHINSEDFKTADVKLKDRQWHLDLLKQKITDAEIKVAAAERATKTYGGYNVQNMRSRLDYISDKVALLVRPQMLDGGALLDMLIVAMGPVELPSSAQMVEWRTVLDEVIDEAGDCLVTPDDEYDFDHAHGLNPDVQVTLRHQMEIDVNDLD